MGVLFFESKILSFFFYLSIAPGRDNDGKKRFSQENSFVDSQPHPFKSTRNPIGRSSRSSEENNYNRHLFSIPLCSPSYFCRKKRYFKDERLNVKLINYPTMFALANDLISGRIDFGQLTVPLTFAIHHGSIPFKLQEKLVMPMILGVHGSNLMVSKDSGITRPDDFKGKTIATHTKLTVHYLLVRLYLESNGVDAERDVKMSIVNLKELTGVLQSGEIDAFMMAEPVNAMAEETGNATTYILNRFIWRYHPCCGLATRRELFDQGDKKTYPGISHSFWGGLYYSRSCCFADPAVWPPETTFRYGQATP
jgi:ABC-type nitrate/sulfonate/bicarbonate transport system substrate-binding protein